MSIYSVSKIKAFQGMDGGGYKATLLRDGKAVAELMDDASGGGVRSTWLDRDAHSVVKGVDHKGEPVEYRGTVEEALFVAYTLTLPKWTYAGMTAFPSTDMVLANLVNAVQTEKRLMRQYKTKLVFTEDGKEYVYGSTAKGVDPMDLLDELKKARPNAVILNLLPLNEAVALSLARGG